MVVPVFSLFPKVIEKMAKKENQDWIPEISKELQRRREARQYFVTKDARELAKLLHDKAHPKAKSPLQRQLNERRIKRLEFNLLVFKQMDIYLGDEAEERRLLAQIQMPYLTEEQQEAIDMYQAMTGFLNKKPKRPEGDDMNDCSAPCCLKAFLVKGLFLGFVLITLFYVVYRILIWAKINQEE